MKQKIVDPRGIIVRGELTLAPRKPLDALREGKLLIYNNTKVEFCNYPEIIPTVKACFEEVGVSNFVDFRRTVRGLTASGLAALADELMQEKPDAVVIVLGDMGVSPASTILTIELEKRGVPTVLITASPGAELAQATAYYRAGKLCLCPINLYQGTSKESIREQIRAQFPFLLDSLTGDEAAVAKRSELRFSLDQKVSDNGMLEELMSLLDAVEDADCEMLIQKYFAENHLTDGLPIVVPTEERVNDMLAGTDEEADTVLAYDIGPTGANITIRDIATNAVMAGCKPEYMPILVAAFRAMSQPRYNFLQSVTTSHPGGNLILVSGPLAKKLGIWGGQGCLGPGFHANATIGRAVNLVLINVCRSVPGICDLDCLASQAEYTYCFSEDPTYSPWQTVNEETYDAETTTVTVLKAEPPHDIIDFLSPTAADLLDTITDSCTTLGSNNSYIPGPLIVVITPDHAMLFERDGYSKKMIQDHIHTFAYHSWPEVQNRGLRPVRPAGFDDRHPIPVTRSPEDVMIVVAGGKGGHSAVILPWALHSDAVTVPVVDKNGNPLS